MAKTAGKKDKHPDKHGNSFIVFSQATGQTWYDTSAYHLSTLVPRRTLLAFFHRGGGEGAPP